MTREARALTVLRLSAAQHQTLLEHAETSAVPRLPRGAVNMSEAARHILDEWNAGRARRGRRPARDVTPPAVDGRRVGVRLSEVQRQVVDDVAARLSGAEAGKSGALRYVLDEWAAGRGRPESERRAAELDRLRAVIEDARGELVALERS